MRNGVQSGIKISHGKKWGRWKKGGGAEKKLKFGVNVKSAEIRL